MSWFRIEGKMPQHAKYAPLSDAAFRLAITAGAWCADHMTDGMLPKSMVSALTRAPRGKALEVAVASLVDAKIWEDKSGSWLIHDFLDWNLSREDWEKKVKAAKAGGASKAAKSPKQQKSSVPHGKPNGRQVASHLPAGCSAITLPLPLPDSDSDSDSDLESQSESQTRAPAPPKISTGAQKFAEAFETTAPDAIEFTTEHREFEANGIVLQQTWLECRDYRRARKERREDWAAEFTSWLRREVKIRRERGNRAPKGQTPPQPNSGYQAKQL